MREWLKEWLDAPVESRRGGWGLSMLAALVVLFLVLIVLGTSWLIDRRIEAATVPWEEATTVTLTLRPVAGSQIEVTLESGCQREQTKVVTLQDVKEGDSVTVTRRIKYFTLPKGKTTIFLPVAADWVRVRVILYQGAGFGGDKFVTEGELFR